jgi:undecaprenyl phosphate N,N'-diacetylbacillosamine 1-phosphate transferase
MIKKFLFLLLIIILSPLFSFIILMIFICDGLPVFYLDKRIGYKGKLFTLYKFRTMVKITSNDDLHSLDRVTVLGNFLRKSSLDEIPQFFNILKGEMNLIGPRPLPQSYLSILDQEVPKRALRPPGLTGLAQVKGRNCLSWRQKFKYDNFYIEKQSVSLDALIIILTFKQVFQTHEINVNNKNTSKGLN